MFACNTTSKPITLREGVHAGTVIPPGASLELGGLAEQVFRSADGRPQSVVDRWGHPGLFVEGDPRCQSFISTTVAGLKALADGELAARSVAGAASATRNGLRFRVALPAGAEPHLVAITAALEATTHMGAAALDVVVEA
jgi:hypothetical protein